MSGAGFISYPRVETSRHMVDTVYNRVHKYIYLFPPELEYPDGTLKRGLYIPEAHLRYLYNFTQICHTPYFPALGKPHLWHRFITSAPFTADHWFAYMLGYMHASVIQKNSDLKKVNEAPIWIMWNSAALIREFSRVCLPFINYIRLYFNPLGDTDLHDFLMEYPHEVQDMFPGLTKYLDLRLDTDLIDKGVKWFLRDPFKDPPRCRNGMIARDRSDVMRHIIN